MESSPVSRLPAARNLRQAVSATLGAIGFTETSRLRNFLLALAVFGFGGWIVFQRGPWPIAGAGVMLFASLLPDLLRGRRFRGPGGALVEVTVVALEDRLVLSARDLESGAAGEQVELPGERWCWAVGPVRYARPAFHGLLVRYLYRFLRMTRGAAPRLEREAAGGFSLLGACAARLEAEGFRVRAAGGTLFLPPLTTGFAIAFAALPVGLAFDLASGKMAGLFVALVSFGATLTMHTSRDRPLRVEGGPGSFAYTDALKDATYSFRLEGKKTGKGTIPVEAALDEDLGLRNPAEVDRIVDAAIIRARGVT